MSQKYESLTDVQKYEFCKYVENNNKKTRAEYIQWIKQKWKIKVKLELALKEFILVYQDQTILSDAIIIKKAKLLVKGFKISENQLKFFNGWLQKFKDRNGIHQIVLHKEATSAAYAKIEEILPILKNVINTL
ncbi:12651_t:CDS:2 [Dentiscutata heterogama]|uniref:12651_t:CDS:1 n=1 Tax=Dentiscutata heterogama TaxID=1316150 RepID=A0ACA9LHW8_9GLOM|nr:12651_t:CDS:2 [Dentiscutata heterogama]